ncbi:ATPase family AAA domain-containing protein 3B [Cytospora mali]|uniref:ATPase family AAA domain-containing protein 3B n=1 Tax=Cytospora mali TaxID=578113 RepID=A0A194VIL7_CYTMA|nr:ATPase family AAA domain-containing protein 3B [Valsa mali]
MDSISQLAGAVTKGGGPTKPRADAEVKADPPDTINAADGPTKSKEASDSSDDDLAESDSASNDNSSESSSDQSDDAEPVAGQKDTKDQILRQDLGYHVARELQRILQLAQAQQPSTSAIPGHSGYGAGLDAGFGSGLSGATYPRSAVLGGLQQGFPSNLAGQSRPSRTAGLPHGGVQDTLDDNMALLDALRRGRDSGLAGRGARRGVPQADGKGAGGDLADPNKKQRHKKHSYKRVDQVWDNAIHNFKLQDTAESATDKQYSGFCFHVRRTFDWEGKYKATVVDIKSKVLRECLQDVIGNIKGVSLVDETPKLDPNMLFLYLEDLRRHLKQLRKQAASPPGADRAERKKEAKRLEEKRKHLKVLVKYIDKDYEHVKNSLYPMLEHGLITFDLLWALWKPNTLAYTTTYGSHDEPRVFKVDTAEKHYHLSKGDFYFIDGKYFEYDGKQFGYGHMMQEIGEFRGAKKITSLNCYPLKYHKNEAQLRKDLVERGKKFVALSGVHYKSHQGMAYYKKKKAVIKVNINGRVMVDPAIHRRINPNYPISLVRPKEHDMLSDDEDSDDEEGCCAVGSDSDDGAQQDKDLEDGEEKVKYVTKLYKDDKGRVQLMQMTKDEADELNKEKLSKVEGRDDAVLDSSGEEEVKPKDSKKAPEFTDEEYLIASPVVLGFSFGEKLWLEFTVSGIKDISWNEKAYESLVLEPKTKETVKALVESHKYHAAESIDDVIQGKGKGLVTVLHGPPGTGKTLTAEGISELLKCPLYMVSAGELGTDSRVLEGELQRILDICHAWGAILLLDEADVFLEKRNMHDIHRNALVSIFLRQLEYFQGILFLTTNRVETFDDAFQSRIHIALRYDPLDHKAKKAIFRMFQNQKGAAGGQQVVPVVPFTEEEYNALARHDLNGRQIKNTVIRAQALAVNKGESLSMVHVGQILDVQVNFDRDLKGGTGYQEALRSYF